MNYPPRLSFAQMFNMSFGFLGIRFGFGLQLANMSAIYAKLDASINVSMEPFPRLRLLRPSRP